MTSITKSELSGMAAARRSSSGMEVGELLGSHMMKSDPGPDPNGPLSSSSTSSRFPGYNNSLPHNYTNYYSHQPPYSSYDYQVGPGPGGGPGPSLPDQYWRGPSDPTVHHAAAEWDYGPASAPYARSYAHPAPPPGASTGRESVNGQLSSSLYSHSSKYGSNNHISNSSPYGYINGTAAPNTALPPTTAPYGGSLRKRPGVYVYGQLQNPLDEDLLPANGFLNRAYNPNHSSAKVSSSSYGSGMDITSTAAAAALVRQLEEKLNQVIGGVPVANSDIDCSNVASPNGNSAGALTNGNGGVGLDIISHVPHHPPPDPHKVKFTQDYNNGVLAGEGTAGNLISQSPNVRPAQIRSQPGGGGGATFSEDEEDEEELCFLLSPFECCPCLGKGGRGGVEDKDDGGVGHPNGHRVNLSAGGEAGKDEKTRCPHSNNRVTGGGGETDNEEEFKRDDYLKSIWIHCRLPLLLLTVSALIILFLLFSGALIYFKYVPFKSRSSLTDEPCEKTTCAFGAICTVESGKAVCKCPERCSSRYDPVCGTDDLSYSNECLLRMFACRNQKFIRVRHGGECDTPNPCATKVCNFGSRCVPSLDGRFATCECPTSCSTGLSETEDTGAVCGSDGKLYRNQCELDKEACRLRRNITARYYGKCDPCEDISCSPPQICHLDEDRRPVCRCGEICPSDYHPVCGSDGKTHTNECMMRQEACRTRRDLRIIYRGKCSSAVNPCESRTCHRQRYETCAINRFGIAQCTCAMKCDPVVVPVCGSDGKTYDNQCQLSFTSCQEARRISISFRGTCEAANACAKHPCPYEATCMERNGETVCECPVCSSDYQPVCGSDGVSYQNDCRLRMEACLTNTDIHKVNSGLCNGCDHMECKFHSKCQSTVDGAKCVCPGNCTHSGSSRSSHVCGTDGVTYENECHLQEESCKQQKTIEVASQGPCDLCSGVECKYSSKCERGKCVCPSECPPSTEPVCGSNLITYSNECELLKASCQLSRPLTIRFYGLCTDAFNTVVDNGDAYGSMSRMTTVGENGENIGYNERDPPTSKLDTNEDGSLKVTWVQIQGPNGKTYGSAPSMRMCDSIRCDFGAVCELAEDGFPRCTCQFNCSNPSPESPVCGSNLKLYASECEMKQEGCLRQSELRPRPMELCDAVEEVQLRELREEEEEACYGDDPLKDTETGEDINCGNGPTATNCPPGSFCHRSLTFTKCCTKHEEQPRSSSKRPVNGVNIFRGGCETTKNGCCPDGVTPAMGPNQFGCPYVSVCQCNKLGSVSENCDLVTQECSCRPGVGGPKCDRCLPGYWGLTQIHEDGHLGCKACSCSRFGSIREDCEQMTGGCMCKPGVLGHQCDSCQQGQFLGPYGCTHDSRNLGSSCSDIVCEFGAACEEDGDRAGCVCNIQCSDLGDNEQVCASDGFTYESECLVRRQGCLNQKELGVVTRGPCPDSRGTENPIQHWTGLHYTEPGDDGTDSSLGPDGRSSQGGAWSDKVSAPPLPHGFSSSGMKSTRHLPPLTKYGDNILGNPYGHRSPTSATVQIRSYLGDSCQWTADCITAHSMCLNGWCICREGYYEDSERIQCKPIHSHLSGVLSCSKSMELCQPPASCFDHRNGSYSCVCPLGKSSGPKDSCTTEDTLTPFFGGRSTIGLDKLAGYHKLSLELEITPYLNYEHGILIFSSQHGNGSGDFLSLALIDGYVEFRYDLGDGPAILRSASRVSAGKTHQIAAKRYNRDGLLRLDGEEDVRGTSPGTMKSLNLDHGGYMGHVPLNSTKIWELVGTSEGFIGCVHSLTVGRRPIDFEEKDPLVRFLSKVHQCPGHASSNLPPSTTPLYSLYEAEAEDGVQTRVANQIQSVIFTENKLSSSSLLLSRPSPVEAEESRFLRKNSCSTSNPCQNHAMCWNDKSNSAGYRCVCHPEFTGLHCESKTYKMEETGAMLDFRGFSYLEIPRIANPARHVSIELWLMVRSKNGIILYDGQESGKGDFITLLVTNGHIQFLFDLGSGMANITWPEPIPLNKWHWIKVTRDGREATLQIDGQVPIAAKSPPTLSELNLELPLYIGGVRDLNIIHRELGLLSPFDGVLQYVKVNGETYHREITSALRQRLVHRYEGGPCGASVLPPCGNGGTCFPRLDSYVCLCSSQFSGKTCENRKETPSPVRFDGQNFIKFPRKINKQESFNASDYDDFYNENFDSQLDELFGSKYAKNVVQQDSLDKAEYFRESDKEYDTEDYDFEDVEYFEEFLPYVDEEIVDRSKAQRRNRIEIVFRTTSQSSGLMLWTGKNARSSLKIRSRKGYLGLFLVDGHLELRIDLGAGRNKKPTVIRSKVKVADGRWHQVLIARQRRLVVLQVDGLIPQRATTPVGSNVLVSDGRYWIGGISPSILPTDVPASQHQGFVGCVDLVRIEKRRLPLSKIAYSTGIPLCEDDD